MGLPHDTKNEQPLEILSYSWFEKVAEITEITRVNSNGSAFLLEMRDKNCLQASKMS